MTDVVLDTDVFSHLCTHHPRASWVARQVADAEVALAFPSVAELHFGAAKARWGDLRVRRLEQDISGYGLLSPDDDLLRLCGRLRADAIRLGHPLGQHRHANDLWIAACAVHYDVPLLTGNARHFAGLPGLRLVA